MRRPSTPSAEYLGRLAGAVVAVAILLLVYLLRVHFAAHPLVGG